MLRLKLSCTGDCHVGTERPQVGAAAFGGLERMDVQSGMVGGTAQASGRKHRAANRQGSNVDNEAWSFDDVYGWIIDKSSQTRTAQIISEISCLRKLLEGAIRKRD